MLKQGSDDDYIDGCTYGYQGPEVNPTPIPGSNSDSIPVFGFMMILIGL